MPFPLSLFCDAAIKRNATRPEISLMQLKANVVAARKTKSGLGKAFLELGDKHHAIAMALASKNFHEDSNKYLKFANKAWLKAVEEGEDVLKT